MEIEDFINKWKNHADPSKLDLSNIYSALLFEGDVGFGEILSKFDIEEEDLTNYVGPSRSEILASCKKIDELLTQTTYVMKNYIFETIYKDLDSEELMKTYNSANENLNSLYESIKDEFVKISNIVFYHYPPSFIINFVIDQHTYNDQEEKRNWTG